MTLETTSDSSALFDPAKEIFHARLYCRNPDSPRDLCMWYWCDAHWELAVPRIERLLSSPGPVLAVFDGALSTFPHLTRSGRLAWTSEHG